MDKGSPSDSKPNDPVSPNGGLGKMFNNTTIKGRANAAKATFASLLIAYIMYKIGHIKCDVKHSHTWQEERRKLEEQIYEERKLASFEKEQQ